MEIQLNDTSMPYEAGDLIIFDNSDGRKVLMIITDWSKRYEYLDLSTGERTDRKYKTIRELMMDNRINNFTHLKNDQFVILENQGSLKK